MTKKNRFNYSERTKILNFDRSKQSVQRWLNAWIQAENKYNPRRNKLMDSYEMALLDNHLFGVIENRQMKVLGEPFIILKDDEPNDVIQKFFKKKWFSDFIKYSLNAIHLGFSVIELHPAKDSIEKVIEIERRNIIPEKDMILFNQYDFSGPLYSQKKVKDFYIFVDGGYGLGLLNKAVYWTIYKRMSAASHAKFNDEFGLPMLLAKTNDEERKPTLLKELQAMAQGKKGVIDLEEEFSAFFPSGTGGEQTFESLEERANSEMSKLILGHVKGTDDNQVSQTYVNRWETNKTPSEERRERDMVFSENIVNDDLMPRLINFGFSQLVGCKFQFLSTYFSETSRKKNALDPAILSLLMQNYDISPKWIEENYGIPVKAKAIAPATPPVQNLDNEEEDIEPKEEEVVEYKPDPFDELEKMYKGFNINSQKNLFDKFFKRFRKLFSIITRRLFDNKQELLDNKLIALTNEIIEEAVSKEIDYDTVDSQVVEFLRKNVFQFSAAKTYKQLKQMSALLVDNNGIRRSFSDFKELVDKLNLQYNFNHLQAEYQIAIATSQSVSRWHDLVREGNELLTYDAVMDGVTTDICRKLNGTTLPASDPFWKKYMTPNHYGERSTIKIGYKIKKPTDLPEISKEFEFNPALDRTIFHKAHPYFKSLPKDIREEIEKLEP